MKSTSFVQKRKFWLICVLAVLSARPSSGDDTTTEVPPRSRLELRPVRAEGIAADWLQGTLRVFEDCKASRGRMIPLYVVVLPAKSDNPAPDPVFVLHGGPGAAATTLASSLSRTACT